MTVEIADNAADFGTGFPALDDTLEGLQAGDNVVWQVDSMEQYRPFATLLAAHARKLDKPLVYFRFARHAPLVEPGDGVTVCDLRPDAGFETFITNAHEVIERFGRGGYFIFDSLSALSLEYFSERMIGNFFALTCPHLYELGAIAYFAVQRNYHSYHAALPIEQTTQILIDVYRYEGKTYVHPLKVSDRSSSTMHMLHAWADDRLVPMRQSSVTAEVLMSSPWPGLQSASYRMIGMWDRRFMNAEESLNNHGDAASESKALTRSLLRHLISRDQRILALAEKNLDLSDLIYVWKRTIGSGLIGGKAVGMILARAILRHADPRWEHELEPHDSFFVGSDIFYSFLVQNDCWWIRQEQKNPETMFDAVAEGRRLILNGEFPDFIVRRFEDMLDYYGQSPIIVRSSSLLEDNYGNAFAGKYESVYCANQGTRKERLATFLDAVRVVYASTMSEEALAYRAKRKVLDRDEQMALLVQRVSGAQYGDLFYPQLAGVALSFNPYAWDKDIDPKSGALRLVFGLGTRAVNRSDDDYTRVVALNAPDKRPEAGFDDVRRYAQRRVDLLDLQANEFTTRHFVDVVRDSPGMPINLFAEYDEETARHLKERGVKGRKPWLLELKRFLSNTGFVQNMRDILETLRAAYGCEVDVEFTASVSDEEDCRINIVQCRPLQVRVDGQVSGAFPEPAGEDIVFEAHGAVIGQSVRRAIDRIVYVDPFEYSQLPERDRYAVARLVGKVSAANKRSEGAGVVLIGPGRWGTSTPSLGVPIASNDLGAAVAVCELDTMREGLTPDLSLGTHFFNELVEMDILYVGYFKSHEGNTLNAEFLSGARNRVCDIVPDAAPWDKVVRVIESSDVGALRLAADPVVQKAIIYTKADPGDE